MNQEARSLFCTLERLLPTAHQLQSFRALIAAFLSADGNPRPAHVRGKSPAALSRFLNRYPWNARAIIRAARGAILVKVEAAARQRRGRKRVLEISVDATCLEKTGSFEGLEIHRLNDKFGLHLVVLYVVLGEQRFPWSFAVWRGKGSKSQARLALSMLRRLPRAWLGWFHVRVLADAGFGSNEFIEGVHGLGFHAVVGVSSDRVTSEGRAMSELRCRGVKVWLRDCSVPVFVSWFKLRRDRGEFVWRYVVSTRPADGTTIRRWGKRRSLDRGVLQDDEVEVRVRPVRAAHGEGCTALPGAGPARFSAGLVDSARARRRTGPGLGRGGSGGAGWAGDRVDAGRGEGGGRAAREAAALTGGRGPVLNAPQPSCNFSARNVLGW